MAEPVNIHEAKTHLSRLVERVERGEEIVIVAAGFVPPPGLDRSEFRLRPLGAEHNEADYAAWTSSMDHIHRTPGFEPDGWPRPMSLEDNRRDLERHAADFEALRGFTYTVLAPTSDEVIGCVYIYPAEKRGGERVKSWVRAIDAGLDIPLHDAVSAWLARDWPFESVAHATR